MCERASEISVVHDDARVNRHLWRDQDGAPFRLTVQSSCVKPLYMHLRTGRRKRWGTPACKQRLLRCSRAEGEQIWEANTVAKFFITNL